MKLKKKRKAAVDLQSIPDGFVLFRMAADAQAMLNELRDGRNLLRAAHDLSKREPYTKLIADLQEVLNSYATPETKAE